ncbi:hypothetical protein K501DRAFT_280332, partial [Backusella circina FSU 941]
QRSLPEKTFMLCLIYYYDFILTKTIFFQKENKPTRPITIFTSNDRKWLLALGEWLLKAGDIKKEITPKDITSLLYVESEDKFTDATLLATAKINTSLLQISWNYGQSFSEVKCTQMRELRNRFVTLFHGYVSNKTVSTLIKQNNTNEHISIKYTDINGKKVTKGVEITKEYKLDYNDKNILKSDITLLNNELKQLSLDLRKVNIAPEIEEHNRAHHGYRYRKFQKTRSETKDDDGDSTLYDELKKPRKSCNEA